MKISHVLIENFRKIERLELDFTDSLGNVRDVSLIVGPNTIGKTTILDALGVGVGLMTDLPYARAGLEFNPIKIVRRGALQARVTTTVRFSQAEIEFTKKVFELSEEPLDVPNIPKATLTWEYPAKDPIKYPRGLTRCTPSAAWRLLKGRVKVARLLRTGRVDWRAFEKVGAVFTFDQQRTGMGKIGRDLWDIIQGISDDEANSRITDPKTILLQAAVRSQVPSINKDNKDKKSTDEFKLIQEKYAEICAPHFIKGVIQDEVGQFDILFSDGDYEYRYDGLSSGEQMQLLLLIRMVTEHIHQSVVLIDEVELHQHPIWQRKLLYMLPKIGKENQIIATTHSDYLRDVVSPDVIIDLGGLLK